MKARPNHYCIMKCGPSPLILEVQTITWFETEDLAWQYWSNLNDKYKLSIGPVACINEGDLPYHFNCNTKYIKRKLTGTRLLKTREDAGVKVTNDQKVIAEYYKPSEGPSEEQMKDGIDIGIYMDLNYGPSIH